MAPAYAGRIAVFAADAEAIRRAVSEASHEEAGQKLNAARAAIDKYVRQLARGPAVKEIVLELKEGQAGKRSRKPAPEADPGRRKAVPGGRAALNTDLPQVTPTSTGGRWVIAPRPG